MSYDSLIKNGTVVDGTGGKPRRADVAITAGKVAEIGKVVEGAKKVIDASDLIVAPGFVDPHTHYDAQNCWDPYHLVFMAWGDHRDHGELRCRHSTVQTQCARDCRVGPRQR